MTWLEKQSKIEELEELIKLTQEVIFGFDNRIDEAGEESVRKLTRRKEELQLQLRELRKVECKSE